MHVPWLWVLFEGKQHWQWFFFERCQTRREALALLHEYIRTHSKRIVGYDTWIGKPEMLPYHKSTLVHGECPLWDGRAWGSDKDCPF